MTYMVVTPNNTSLALVSPRHIPLELEVIQNSVFGIKIAQATRALLFFDGRNQLFVHHIHPYVPGTKIYLADTLIPHNYPPQPVEAGSVIITNGSDILIIEPTFDSVFTQFLTQQSNDIDVLEADAIARPWGTIAMAFRTWTSKGEIPADTLRPAERAVYDRIVAVKGVLYR